MKFIKNILSRGLPKTGQVTEHVAGDDGTYEAGWWLKRLNANNRTRFVAKTIGSDVVVYDRATGLLWAADGNAVINNSGATIAWAAGIAYPIGKTHAGFSDWRVPNLKELWSIAIFDVSGFAAKEPPFINTDAVDYWTSTTFSQSADYAWYVLFESGATVPELKTDVKRIRCVRKGI